MKQAVNLYYRGSIPFLAANHKQGKSMICVACKGLTTVCTHECICQICNGSGRMIVCQKCGLNFGAKGSFCFNCEESNAEKRIYLPPVPEREEDSERDGET